MVTASAVIAVLVAEYTIGFTVAWYRATKVYWRYWRDDRRRGVAGEWYATMWGAPIAAIPDGLLWPYTLWLKTRGRR